MISWLLSSIVHIATSMVKLYIEEVIKPIAIDFATKTAFTVLRVGF